MLNNETSIYADLIQKICEAYRIPVEFISANYQDRPVTTIKTIFNTAVHQSNELLRPWLSLVRAAEIRALRRRVGNKLRKTNKVRRKRKNARNY